MTDMSQFIAAKSDQLNADDLIGGPITVRITKVTGKQSADQPVNISFENDMGKPFRPCKSMRRVLVQVWGKDGAAYVGKEMTLYRDPNVKWGGAMVGGIRISHMSDITEPKHLMLTATRGQKAEYMVRPLTSGTGGMSREQVEKQARAAAALGKGKFLDWYNSSEGKAARAAQPAVLQGLMSTLQEIAENAPDDPFGLPPAASSDEIEPSEKPSEDEIQEAMEAAQSEVIDNAPSGLG